MALKEQVVVIEKGRDAGKKFLITEMPAYKFDNLAMRMLAAVASSGVSLTNFISESTGIAIDNIGDLAALKEIDPLDGAIGLLNASFNVFGMIPTSVSMPILDELLSCVQFIPDGGRARPINHDLGDVEDFRTLWKLRFDAYMIHVSF